MMTIRDVIPKDHDLYLELAAEFYSGEATLHSINLEYTNRTFAECARGNSPYARALMLEEDGVSVGFALFSLTWSNESGGLAVWLEELYIRPQFRGRGLGVQFMEWMLEEYRDASRLRLELTRNNDGARRLYQRYGFVPLDYEQMVRDKDTQ